MIRPITIFGWIFVCAVLTGCAGVSRVPLDKTASSKLTGVETKLSIPADEIIVRAEPSKVSAVMGGGLIAALIDAHVTASRQTALEKLSAPFYEGVDAVDFRGLFGNSFKTAISGYGTLPNLNVSVSTRGLSKDEIKEQRSKLKPGESLLGLRLWYEFTPDAQSLIVAAAVQMIVPDHPEPIYTNMLLYTSKRVGGVKPLETWAENQGQALIDAYRESAQEIANMLRLDLDAPDNDTIAANLRKQAKVKVTVPSYGPFILSPNGALVPLTTEGYLVAQTDQRQIVRSEGGALYSVSK